MDEMSVPCQIEQDNFISEIISGEIFAQDPISAVEAGSGAHLQADSASAALHAEVFRGELRAATRVWGNFVDTVLPHFSVGGLYMPVKVAPAPSQTSCDDQRKR